MRWARRLRKLIEEQVDIFAFLNHVFEMGVE